MLWTTTSCVNTNLPVFDSIIWTRIGTGTVAWLSFDIDSQPLESPGVLIAVSATIPLWKTSYLDPTSSCVERECPVSSLSL